MSSSAQVDQYRAALETYLQTRSEDALYQASLLTESFIRDGLGPEDITLMHCEGVQDLLEASDGRTQLDRLRGLGDAHQFLLEIMISYGVKYREYAERVLADSLLKVESASGDRQRAELLAMIAHEIATPLTVAHGGVSRASKMLTAGDVEHAGPALTFARTALDRLRHLNDELREASLGEHNEDVQLPLLSHDLRQIVDISCNWASVLAEEKGVTLVREHSGTPLPVVCNSDSMQTVLINLLSNAIHYTPAGGTVSLRHYQGEQGPCVEVTDTGIGMTEEEQEHLFEKFFRGSQARTMSRQGLGLGMAITKQLVDAQGGQISVVRSVTDEGTTIRVTLPAHD